MKKLLCMLLLATVMIGATSCGNDDEPKSSSSNGLFAGKEFSAEYNYIEGIWAVMTFDGKSGVGYDGHFDITLYDKDGRKLNVKQNRTGKYQYDVTKGRIYLTWDDGSMAGSWNYSVGSEMTEWPYWKNNIIISVPSSSSSDYSSLTFYPGNVYKNPNK